jgi:hypothetical protein
MSRYLDIFLNKRELYPFEKAILQSVVACMDEESRRRLQLQIEAVNKVQRICDGKEVNLYRMRYGKVAFDYQLCFPNVPPELLLARVNLRLPNRKAVLTAKVWMVGGYIFSLEFNTSPREFFAGIGLQGARPEIADVKLLCDCL